MSEDKPTVIDRRKWFAKTSGVSVSTVERLEEKGADALSDTLAALRSGNAIIAEFERMDERLTVLSELMHHYRLPMNGAKVSRIRANLAALRNEVVKSRVVV